MTKLLSAALFASTSLMALPAAAATLSGTFDVRVVNFNAGGVAADAKADQANFDARWAAASAGQKDEFAYSGFIDFHVDNFPKDIDAESISEFLATGVGGSVTGLDATVGGLTLSNPTFQTTTLFEFTLTSSSQAFTFDVVHDDGITAYDDGIADIAFSNPTGVRTTSGGSFDGGQFSLVYAAANGNPSKLHVTNVAPVPLPASSLFLIGGLAAMGAMARRKAKNTA